jgi:hypothetical protein
MCGVLLGFFTIERLQKEAEEDARLKLEAKITFEKKQAWLKAEHERLQVETNSISIFMNMRDSSLAKIEAVGLAILDVIVNPLLLSSILLCSNDSLI